MTLLEPRGCLGLDRIAQYNLWSYTSVAETVTLHENLTNRYYLSPHLLSKLATENKIKPLIPGSHEIDCRLKTVTLSEQSRHDLCVNLASCRLQIKEQREDKKWGNSSIRKVLPYKVCHHCGVRDAGVCTGKSISGLRTPPKLLTYGVTRNNVAFPCHKEWAPNGWWCILWGFNLTLCNSRRHAIFGKSWQVQIRQKKTKQIKPVFKASSSKLSIRSLFRHLLTTSEVLIPLRQ